MRNNKLQITECSEANYPELVAIWEGAVRATHTFLDEEAISAIKAELSALYFPAVELYAAVDSGRTVGFVGLNGDSIEMLFVDCGRFGCGYGSALMDFARRRGACKVDVNEQNPRALEFYLAHGFRICGRDECDDAGRPYPILHLGL